MAPDGDGGGHTRHERTRSRVDRHLRTNSWVPTRPIPSHYGSVEDDRPGGRGVNRGGPTDSGSTTIGHGSLTTCPHSTVGPAGRPVSDTEPRVATPPHGGATHTVAVDTGPLYEGASTTGRAPRTSGGGGRSSQTEGSARRRAPGHPAGGAGVGAPSGRTSSPRRAGAGEAYDTWAAPSPDDDRKLPSSSGLGRRPDW